MKHSRQLLQIIIAAGWLFCAIATHAEKSKGTSPSMLGGTLAELSRRYGKPEESDSGTFTFNKEGMYVRVRFFEGKCESIGFTKTSIEPFSDAEFQALREENSDGGKWKPSVRLRFGGETWESANLSRFAVRWGNSPHMVFIQTRASLERMGGPFKEQIKQEESARGNR